MVAKTKNEWAKLSASKMVESLLEKAIAAEANFIHIEPSNDAISVRFRVNGLLGEAIEIPKKRFISLVERFKTLANLDVRERRIPQDGRFKTTVSNHAYSFNISVIPTVNGEKVTISIQDNEAELPSLINLGLWGNGLKAIQDVLKLKRGAAIITGPTDSGKSTTIYSILGNIDDGANIATIEDPVEYKLPNANQTQVNEKANLSFSIGLKVLVKHDTDVIMVSELRDNATTKLFYETASRGRLVIGSLYIDNAPAAISLLENLGTGPAQVAHLTKLITSQRLVRRLCPSCREIYEPDRLALIQIEELFSINSPARMRALHKLELEFLSTLTKSPAKTSLNTTESKIKKLWRPHAGGCDKCSNTGYKGRVGIFEVMSISPAVQKLITGRGSTKVIQEQAIKDGMVTIQIDGLVKALTGITSIDEIIRFGLEDTVL